MALTLTLKEMQARMLALLNIHEEYSVMAFYKTLFFALTNNEQLRKLLAEEIKKLRT